MIFTSLLLESINLDNLEISINVLLITWSSTIDTIASFTDLNLSNSAFLSSCSVLLIWYHVSITATRILINVVITDDNQGMFLFCSMLFPLSNGWVQKYVTCFCTLLSFTMVAKYL